VRAEQWLQLHELCLDTVRGALAGIPVDLLVKEVAIIGTSVGREVAHLIDAEAYWLKEVGIVPNFFLLPVDEWSEATFNRTFDQVQKQYEEVLRDQGLQRDILFGLGRVCQHALYHHVRITKMRMILDADWTVPPPYETGSWARAADYLTDLLIASDSASPRSKKHKTIDGISLEM